MNYEKTKLKIIWSYFKHYMDYLNHNIEWKWNFAVYINYIFYEVSFQNDNMNKRY